MRGAVVEGALAEISGDQAEIRRRSAEIRRRSGGDRTCRGVVEVALAVIGQVRHPPALAR